MHKKLTPKEIFNNIISLLKDLHKTQPEIDICRIISDSTADYPNIWGISNKEFLHLLEKYKFEIENEVLSTPDSEVYFNDNYDELGETPFEEDEF